MFKTIKLLFNYMHVQYCYNVEKDPARREAFLGTMMIDLDELTKRVCSNGNIRIVAWVAFCSLLSIFTIPWYTMKYAWHTIKTKCKK